MSCHLKGFQYLQDHGTTHLAIIDKDGIALTMTTTINTYFGTGVLSHLTGMEKLTANAKKLMAKETKLTAK